MTKNSYILTNHVRDRFQERFGYLGINWNSLSQIDTTLRSFLDNSKLNCAYMNDTAFMTYLYDRYGYDTRYEFMVNAEHKVVFVINLVLEDNKTIRLVKTCFQIDNQMFGVRTKFKKKLNSTKRRNVMEEMIEEGLIHQNS